MLLLFVIYFAFCQLLSIFAINKFDNNFDDIETALKRLNLEKFLDSLHDAGLQDVFSARGRLTLFAPTNEAIEMFKKQNTNKSDLNDYLKYHISNSWSPSLNHWQNEQLLPTWLPGNSLRVNSFKDLNGNQITTVNGAKVLSADNKIVNGMIHVLDKVLQPSYSIYDTVRMQKETSAFLDHLIAANVVKKLKYEEPITLFAPVDSVWTNLPDSFTNNLRSDLPMMTAIVYHHMLNGTHYFPTGLVDTTLKSIEGSELSAKSGRNFGGINEDDVKILATYPATNGVVHVINKMLLPKSGPKQIMYTFKEQNLNF